MRSCAFEASVPADHEIYFAIDSTRYRAPTITITHHGGMDIEEPSKDQMVKLPVAAIANQRGRHGSTPYREVQSSRIRCVERRAANG